MSHSAITFHRGVKLAFVAGLQRPVAQLSRRIINQRMMQSSTKTDGFGRVSNMGIARSLFVRALKQRDVDRSRGARAINLRG